MALSESEELELLELEEEEAKSAPSGPNAAPQPAQPEPQKNDLQRLQNVVGALRTGQPTPGVGRDALNLASAPFRGVRAATIGAGKLLAGEGVEKSVMRANEALSPDFKPENASEKLASASSAILEIAAPLGQASRAVKAGRVATELGTIKGAKAAVEGLKSKAGINVEKAIEPVTKKFATPLVNAFTNMRKSGALKKLPLQDLHEAEVQLRNLLDAERVGGFAKFLGKKPAGRLTDQAVALAAKAKDAIIKEQNLRVKGLEVARRRVGDIYSRNRIRNIIFGTLAAGAAKKALGPAAGAAGSVATEVVR